jgi:SHS2 domain-containing protein
VTYELRDHTADVAVEASASTLSASFGAVADGLTAASCESIPQAGGDRFAVDVAAEGRKALLFEYLDRLIYERDVRSVLPADHEARVVGPGETAADDVDGGETAASGLDDDPDGFNGPEDADDDGGSHWRVMASARGIPLTDVAAREVKAVTYSEMTLERRNGSWYAYVVFDV